MSSDVEKFDRKWAVRFSFGAVTLLSLAAYLAFVEVPDLTPKEEAGRLGLAATFLGFGALIAGMAVTSAMDGRVFSKRD